MNETLELEIKQKIENEYNIQIYSVLRLNSQEDRSVWLVRTNNHDVTLRIFSNKHLESEVEQDLNTLKFLEQHDFPAPYLINTQKGENYTKIGNFTIAFTTFVRGQVASKTPEVFSKLGILVARLHLLGENNHDSPLISKSRWQPNVTVPRTLKSINNLLESEQYEMWKPVLLRIKEGLESLPSFSQLPKTIIHTDIHERNLVLSGDNSTLIDWYDAGWGPAIVDIGYVLAQSCLWERHLDSDEIYVLEDYIESFSKAYQNIRKLSKIELDSLIWAMRFGNYSYAANAVIDAVKNDKNIDEFLKTHHDWKRFKYLQTAEGERSIKQLLGRLENV